MTPETRRIVIPIIVLLCVGLVVLLTILGSGKSTPPTPDGARQADVTENQPDENQPAEPPVTETDHTEPGDSPQPTQPQEQTKPPTPAEPPVQEESDEQGEQSAPPIDLTGLHAVAPEGTTPPAPIGSLDWREATMLVEFAPAGHGISRITFSDIWETARARRQADQIQQQIVDGEKTLDELPAEQRYVLTRTHQLATYEIPPFSARFIEIEGEPVSLFGRRWSQVEAGHFVSEIRNEAGETILRVEREFILPDDSFDLTLKQRVTNVTQAPISVRWIQYGPSDLVRNRSAYLETRRYRFGYLPNPAEYPNRDLVLSADGDLTFNHKDLLDRSLDAAQPGVTPEQVNQLRRLWPNESSEEYRYELSWFAATNRYFALAMHPVPAGENASKSLAEDIDEIWFQHAGPEENAIILTELFSPPRIIEPSATAKFDIGLYAGPLDRDILSSRQPYVSLEMGGMILYQMSQCCAACTFQWLANFLMWLLSGLHAFVFDWAVAIILLVVVVRLLLHPVTRRSQISMQRFSKTMQAFKPEMDKLQQKYKDDPKRLQQEQIALYREKGINPLGCVGGMLPMLLQMPIWVALYAVLYFSFELRQEAAFYGVFQLFNGWSFLADLSASDHFFWEFATPWRPFWSVNITGLNLLPILMGVMFFLQQKYLSPPPSPSMSKEQLQQQKIMKVLMVTMMPLFLYSAPSGLTLYILTSSTWGILESKHIRNHIDQMDLEPKKKKEPSKTKGKGKKPRDLQGRMYADALERAKNKRKKVKTYKKRR